MNEAIEAASANPYDDFTAQKLADLMVSSGDYIDARVLEDGSVAAIGRLLFTVAIYTGCDDVGWKRRYCYNNEMVAMTEYLSLKNMQTLPSGWIATRP